MKPILIFLFLLSPLFIIAQTWESIPMQGGGYVVGINPHPTEENTVFATIDVGGIFKSTDQGDNWINITQTLPLLSQRHFQVRSMVIDPINPDNIYFVAGNAAFSGESGFWQTNNGGESWTQGLMPTQTNGNHFGRHAGEVLALHPDNPSKIYLAGHPYYDNGTWVGTGGLFVSEDKGLTWTKLDGDTFNTAWIHDIQFKQGDSNKILLATSAFKESWMTNATDNEGLWEYDLTTQSLTQLRTEDTFSFAFDAVEDNTIIAVWKDGIYISENAGLNWTMKVPFADYTYHYFVTPHPTESGHWFFGYWNAIYNNGIIETTDGGQTFTDVRYSGDSNKDKLSYPAYADHNQQPSFANASSSFEFSPVNNAIVYTGDWWGVWRTTDAVTSTNIANDNASITDNANWSWTWATKGIRSLVQLRVGKHPTIDGLFFNCVADIGYYKVNDFGNGLTEHKTAIPISSVYNIAFEKNNPQVGYAVGLQYNHMGRITKTTNLGVDWWEPSTGQQYASSYFEIEGSGGITDLQIAGNSSESLVVGIVKDNMPSQIYRSDDHGETFYAWDEGISGIDLYKIWTPIDRLIKSADGLTFYTWNQNKFYKRGIDDASWQAITQPVSASRWIAQVITHPTEANTIYFTQYSHGIYKSTDAGQTWTTLPQQGAANKELAISPDGQQLAVAEPYNFGSNTIQKIHYTKDDGQNWKTLDTKGLYTPAVGISFLSNSKLVAWTEGSGSYTYDIEYTKLSESGNLFDKIEGIINTNPGESGEEYRAPNTTELATWNTVLQHIYAGDIDTATQLAGSLDYQLIRFEADTEVEYIILSSKRINGNHWGTYVYNPTACQSNLIIQSPHPHNDTNTGLQGIYAFENASATFFMVAGTHRCNNTAHSSCSGTTSTCGITSESFRISDMAHTNISLFHQSTEYLWEHVPDPYFMQLHGFGKGASDPYLILSNGTTQSPDEDLISELGDILVAIDPTLSFEVAHINTGIRLKGTTNTQGRLINGSADACEVSATTNSGRFFHIEQELSKLRSNETGWQKLSLAFDQLFRNIDIQESVLATGSYRTKDSLTTISRIESSSKVDLKAGVCIVLKAGFETKLGSELSASIVSCASTPSELQQPIAIPLAKLATPRSKFSISVYPNPIKQNFTIEYQLSKTEDITIYLLDVMGQQAQLLLPNTRKDAGSYQLQTAVNALQAGTYYLVATGSEIIEPIKLVVLPAE